MGTAGSDSFATLVSSLTSLAQHVQAIIKLIDNAIARETICNGTDASNVIVLDDVTPRYLKASLALGSCSASLNAALKSLLEGEAYRSAGGQGWPVAARPGPSCTAKYHWTIQIVSGRTGRRITTS